MKDLVNLLKEIGLNRIEANIYLALLQETSATGYKIAKLIGEPVSNTYKSILSLQRKGAIFVDESVKPKICIPVPISEFYQTLEESFNQNRIQIEKELKKYSAKSPREGIFQLENYDQVFDRIKHLIKDAQSIILADVFPLPLIKLQNLLEKKANQGVKVLIKAYDPITIKGCDVVIPFQYKNRTKWKFDWCNIIIDNKDFLLSFLDPEQNSVFQAIWSRSQFLNKILSTGFIHEFILTKIGNALNNDTSLEEVKNIYTKYYNQLFYENQSWEAFQ